MNVGLVVPEKWRLTQILTKVNEAENIGHIDPFST